MRKMFFACLVLLLPGLPLMAQSSFVQPVIFGLKGGLDASFFTKDIDFFDPASSGNDPSFQRFLRAAAFAGITVDYMVGERFSVGAEVLYNARGMAYRQKNNSVITIGHNGAEQAYNYFKYKVDYLELPLTAGYNVLPVASDNWLTGYVGLAPAIAVNKAVKLDFPQPNAGPWEGQSDKSGNLDDVRAFNASMLAGVQFGGVPSFIGAYADLRASYTLLPVFAENTNLNGDNLNTRMLSFSFGIGFKF